MVWSRGVLAFLCFGVAGYAVFVYGFLPLGSVVHPDMRVSFESHRALVYGHIFASALALVLGPLQFWAALRSAYPAVHRAMGRVYLGVGVLVGGVCGLLMAPQAYGGLTSSLGFGALAVAWLYSGLRAYRAIRSGNVALHRRWMVRNFALSFAAVTLRLWLPLSMGARLPFEVAYPVIAWLCWVPNVMIAEILLRRQRTLRDA